MRAQDHMLSSIQAMDRSIAEASDMLRLFNEPDWPEMITSAITAAAEMTKKHRGALANSVGDDFANLAGILAQLRWPADIQDRERDDRVASLRGVVGILRMDIDAVLHIKDVIDSGQDLGSGSTIYDSALVNKEGRENIINSIAARLDAIDALMQKEISPEAREDRPRRQVNIVSHFLETMRINIETVRAALRVGPMLDLAVVARAAGAMAAATKRLFATVSAVASKATDALISASRRIRLPVVGFVREVSSFARTIVRDEGAISRPASVPQGDGEGAASGPEGIERVGKRLVTAREKAGMTLADVSYRTRISLRHLQAIEDGEYNLLPSEVYVTGFVANYASAVGEDPYEFRHLARAELKGWPSSGWRYWGQLMWG